MVSLLMAEGSVDIGVQSDQYCIAQWALSHLFKQLSIPIWAAASAVKAEAAARKKRSVWARE